MKKQELFPKGKKTPEELDLEFMELWDKNEKFRQAVEKYGREWEQYRDNPIDLFTFTKKYHISGHWLPLIRQRFGIQLTKPKKKGGETMEEERKNPEQQIGEVIKKFEQEIESMKNVLLEIQKRGKEDTTQSSVKPEEKTPIDEEKIANAILKARQKEIELKKKQREEELKKQEELNKIKQEGKKELIQQLIDKCRLDPNAPECQGLNFNDEEQVVERISKLVEKGRQPNIPVITPKLRGQVLRESILGNPKGVSEIIDELYEKNPEAIKQLFDYCAGGKCSIELKNILQKKIEGQKKVEEKVEAKPEAKAEEKQETKKRLFRSS